MAAATSDTTTALTALPSTISLIGGHASKPWADTPYPLIDTIPSTSDIPPKHSCREMAYTMTQIHNAILRGINAIYNQALSVKAGSLDTADFLFYNRCVYDFLHHHHVNEEKTFFPLLQKLTRDPTFCDTGRQEHDVFDVGAGKWREYIDNVKLEEYDGQKLKGLIEAFGPSLHQHLTNEIAWLLTLSKYDSNACKKAMLETGKKAEAEVTLSKCVYPLLHLFSVLRLTCRSTSSLSHGLHPLELD